MTAQSLNQANVLILSDDTEFARNIAARWQAERYVPEITLATTDIWKAAGAADHAVVIVGPGANEESAEIFSSFRSARTTAVICVANNERDLSTLRVGHPHVLVVWQHDGWVATLILVAGEALRRIDAVNRADRAERLASESDGAATLGRYMLDMRPSVYNALTTVLGNADLLLLEPGQMSAPCRDQIQTIHSMALRLNEIMQRFSSLATELRAGEKDSQAETDATAAGLVAGD